MYAGRWDFHEYGAFHEGSMQDCLDIRQAEWMEEQYLRVYESKLFSERLHADNSARLKDRGWYSDQNKHTV